MPLPPLPPLRLEIGFCRRNCFVRRRTTEIMLGVREVIFGRHRIAGGWISRAAGEFSAT